MGLFVLLAGAAAALAAPACPIDRAIYRHRTAPGFTAGFIRQDRRKGTASDLAFWLKTPKRHTYYFSFSSPNGYGGSFIAPDVDPRRSIAAAEPIDPPAQPDEAEPALYEFDAFAADLSAFEMPPQARDKAPALLFARGLGPALNYAPSRLAAGAPGAEVEYLPIGLFEPAGCAPAKR
jgi:hypothetical protein